MEVQGNIKKMIVEFKDPIKYDFSLLQSFSKQSNFTINLNSLLNKEIKLTFTGKINCINCNKFINKTFNQGFCYSCFKKLASCDMCILKPELCHYHKDTCREPDWGLANCFNPHFVYLSSTSGLKVGITRESQIPTRWIDQGAIRALPMIKVASRYQAGLIEVLIAKIVSDKTNWRKMLTTQVNEVNLENTRDNLISDLGFEIQKISENFDFGDIEILTKEKVLNFSYPVLSFPKKVKTLKFDNKTMEIKGVLKGIKGQYLIFEDFVINVRKFIGYEIKFFSVD